jgi:antitoxin component of RelBE/YafQ-DinJ toxin-antitoxin module
MAEKSILTNLRLPESLNERAREAARRMGVPRNTYIKVVLAAVVTSEEMSRTILTSEQLAVVERAVELARDQTAPEEVHP